jgi:hypothetical protein
MNQSAIRYNLCKECGLLDWEQIQIDSYILKPSRAVLVKRKMDADFVNSPSTWNHI